MDLSQVIAQLRAFCPALDGRVAGAGDFPIGTQPVVAFTDSNGTLVYPTAIVIPLEDDAGQNEQEIGLYQMVTETIGVVVEFDSTGDRRGQAGVTQVEAMKYALFAALLNWQITPERTGKGLYYAGGSLLDFDRARLFWEYRFSLDVLITDADGFQPRGDPLTDIESTVPVPVPIPDPPQDPAPSIVFDAKV
jgi:hypothetical protein